MDVKELLQSKNIEFISRGRDYVVRCLNPEHEDLNPSMNIDKLSGIFHCYSCGFKGDIYQHFNIRKERFINVKIQCVREKIFSLLNIKSLPLPLDATRITSDFRNISVETLKKFGAFTTESINGMSGRIVFPIYNMDGKITMFQGRYMYSDLDPKYKTYPEHTTLPLYPQIVDSKFNSIILVEGLFDMINLHDKGLTNAVCTFGTAFGSTRKHKKQKENIDKLLNYKYQGIDTIYVMFDGDKAGRSAAANLISYAGKSFMMDTIELGDGLDPGSLTKQDVNKLFGELYGEGSTYREVSH